MKLLLIALILSFNFSAQAYQCVRNVNRIELFPGIYDDNFLPVTYNLYDDQGTQLGWYLTKTRCEKAAIKCHSKVVSTDVAIPRNPMNDGFAISEIRVYWVQSIDGERLSESYRSANSCEVARKEIIESH